VLPTSLYILSPAPQVLKASHAGTVTVPPPVEMQVSIADCISEAEQLAAVTSPAVASDVREKIENASINTVPNFQSIFFLRIILSFLRFEICRDVKIELWRCNNYAIPYSK
jgi:hypothetical protein